MSSLTVPPKGGVGGTIVVSDTTTNLGAAAVAESATRFYLSTDTILNAADMLLSGARAVPALAAGAGSTGSTTLSLPTRSTSASITSSRRLMAITSWRRHRKPTTRTCGRSRSGRLVGRGPDDTVHDRRRRDGARHRYRAEFRRRPGRAVDDEVLSVGESEPRCRRCAACRQPRGAGPRGRRLEHRIDRSHHPGRHRSRCLLSCLRSSTPMAP